VTRPRPAAGPGLPGGAPCPVEARQLLSEHLVQPVQRRTVEDGPDHGASPGLRQPGVRLPRVPPAAGPRDPLQADEQATATRRASASDAHRVVRRRVGLAGDPVPVAVEPVRVAPVGPQHGLGVRLAAEVPAVEGVAPAEVGRGVEAR